MRAGTAADVCVVAPIAGQAPLHSEAHMQVTHTHMHDDHGKQRNCNRPAILFNWLDVREMIPALNEYLRPTYEKAHAPENYTDMQVVRSFRQRSA